MDVQRHVNDSIFHNHHTYFFVALLPVHNFYMPFVLASLLATTWLIHAPCCSLYTHLKLNRRVALVISQHQLRRVYVEQVRLHIAINVERWQRQRLTL